MRQRRDERRTRDATFARFIEKPERRRVFRSLVEHGLARECARDRFPYMEDDTRGDLTAENDLLISSIRFALKIGKETTQQRLAVAALAKRGEDRQFDRFDDQIGEVWIDFER